MVEDPNYKTEWWKEGWDAYGEYYPEDCPYEEDTVKYHEWLAGYQDASYDKDVVW